MENKNNTIDPNNNQGIEGVVDEASKISSNLINEARPTINNNLPSQNANEDVASQLIPNVKPQNKIKKLLFKHKVISILVSILLIAISGGLIFYFGYWTRPEVVYGRFQNKISEIFTKTITSETELIDDLKFEAELSNETGEGILKLNSAGRLLDSSLDINSDIEYENANINLGVLTSNSNSRFEFYLKYKGIENFYKTLSESETIGEDLADFSSVIDVLKKYDDKWIYVDIFSLLSDDDNQDETLTKEDYKIVVDIVVPIINARYIGLDKDNAVISKGNIRSEKIAGQSAYAYDVEINKDKYNSMVDEIIKGIKSSKLTQSKKDAVTELLEGMKEDTKSSGSSSYSSSYSKTTKKTIWLNKLTGLPVKYTEVDQTKEGSRTTNYSDVVFEITNISLSKIQGKISSTTKNYDYKSGDEKNNSLLKLDFMLDNKTSDITYSGTYDPDNTKDKDMFRYSIKFKKNDNKAKIEAPKDFVDSGDIIDELQNLE